MFLRTTWTLVFLFTVVSCQGQHQQQQKVYDAESAALLMKEVDDVYWASATAYRQAADEALSPEILMREKLRPFYVTMQKYDWERFNDTLLRRQFEVILRGAKHLPVNEAFERSTSLLKQTSRRKWTCPKGEETNCNWAFMPHIKHVLVQSDDLDELAYYWQEWRNKLPNDIKMALIYYLGYYQKLSSPEKPASSIWYNQYDDVNFIDELEEVMNGLRPFYRQLHAHLRHVLIQHYGPDVVPPTGLIPHHLLEQVTFQAWKKNSVLRNPFPDRKLPNLQAELGDLDPLDLLNISTQFFSSIGINNLTEQFMRLHFIPLEAASAGPDCHARLYDFGEIELHYCPKVTFKKLLQTHADISKVEYALAKNDLSVGLNEEACPGFGAALGEAAILSVSTPKYLQKRLKLLQNYDYDSHLNLNRLYRMAIHTLLTLPQYFVHEKLWVDMIDNKVDLDDYNCHYWNLMQQYMGVDAPLQTGSDTLDLPYKFFEGIVDEQRSTKKLFAEFLGYQVYRELCLRTGEYQPDNDSKRLHNCDLSNHKLAGDVLSEMMSLGSSKPWREIVQLLNPSGTTKLTASAFLEYFSSIHSWITEDNISKKLAVGWTSVDKCKLKSHAN